MSWHAKSTGAYARTSTEAIENAQEMYSILSGLGWTVNAVAGMLGNIGNESGYNPLRWQSDEIGTTSSSRGYGLVQWTPAGNYINDTTAQSYTGYDPSYSGHTGSASDGHAQTLFINLNQVDDGEGGKGAQYYINPDYSYNLTWASFKASTLSASYLAKAWLHNFERPADQSTSVENKRAEEAEYWYGVLSGETPTTTYSVTIAVSGNGSASASPSTGIEAGETVTLSATPDTGATFEGWTVVSGDVTISNNSFTMPASNVTILAAFSGGTTADTYNVTVLTVGNGSASASPNSDLSGGETITLTETPATGYTFSGWTVIIGGITIVNNSFTMPETNVIIQADFIEGVTPTAKKKSKWIYYMRPAWVR